MAHNIELIKRKSKIVVQRVLSRSLFIDSIECVYLVDITYKQHTPH